MRSLRPYLSLLLLFCPPLLFAFFLYQNRMNTVLGFMDQFPFAPFQFWGMLLFGAIATVGGLLDWRYHRNPLQLKIARKERDAEAAALGLGGLPMFVLMWLAMLHARPTLFLIPILIVLIYTVAMICYDEFVFHRNRCGKQETIYHRMLVLGNGLAWLCWFHFIYVK